MSWLKYTLKRLLMLIPVIICVTFILYVILSFAPGNVAWQILGEDATQEQIAQLEAEMGLDQPLLVRYGKYMLGVCRLDFGTSWFGGEDIAKLFLGRLPFTLLVAVLSILFAVALGCPLGIGSAIKQYSLMDYGISFVAMLLTSMPAFWLGTMCQILFCLTLKWLPVSGVGTWKHYVLPSVILGANTGVDDPDEPHQSIGCDPAGLYTDSTGEGRVRMESDHASCHEKQPDPHCDTDRHYFCGRDRGCGGDGKYFRDTGRGRAADQCGEGPRRTDCDGHGYFCDNHCRHDQSGS